MKIEIPDELIEAFVEDQANKCAARGEDTATLNSIKQSLLYNEGVGDYIFELYCDLLHLVDKKIPEMKASQEEAWEESKREQRKQADNLSQF